EIKDVNQDLWHIVAELREVTRNPYLVRSRRYQFVGMLEDLRDHLALHFALEEAYGYFDEPLKVDPRLSSRAKFLRSQHRELYLVACDLIDHAMQLHDGHNVRALARRLVAEYADFDTRLRRHEQAENELIQQEWDEDIGVGD
ncbi:MAG: hypothetical protein QGF59_17235, partial [Pirellulaceae bacterium]|nr:hypothetical protein [Pirellulaceae bacterium]